MVCCWHMRCCGGLFHPGKGGVALSRGQDEANENAQARAGTL